MVYSEPSITTCFDVINVNHHRDHHHLHHNNDHPHQTSPITPNQPPPIKAEEQDGELVKDDDDDGEGDEEEGEEDFDDDDEDENDDEDAGDDGDADDDEEEEEDDDDEDESEEDSEGIVDPGQHCQNVQSTSSDQVNGDLIARDESREAMNDILDGERMLEVTRKLVRNTERDPDRDLRKQVLLKTAIKKLPHFIEYSHYTDSLDRSFHSNISPQAYYEHHDSQKFYHSVQPNAIQMSTTSLRMLDLNDDHDPELNNIEQEHVDPNLGYNSRTSLEQHDYVSQHQYDRYHQRAHDLNPYETSNPMISRHNSIENLYQPANGSDINEDIKDGNERIPIAFQIACEIYDFTCAPDDNERKLLDNLTNSYYTPTRPTKELRANIDDGGGEDGTETRDQDVSDASSSSQSSSSSDDSANSIASQSTEDEVHGASLLVASLNSTSDFYHNSHDSGVALFSPRSNKRSSSLIGLDDEMEIDHLTELSNRSPSIGSNNQYKKLRKREIID